MDYYGKLKAFDSSDQLMVTEDKEISILSLVNKQNIATVNGVSTNRVSAKSLYCTGDVFIYGRFNTTIKAAKGILFSDGSESAPSITFENNQHTGFYNNGGTIGVTVGGVTQMLVNSTSVEINSQISTASGNLIINPAGHYVDFTGHTLINVGGLTVTVGNPNDVIVNNSAGVLSSESQLATIRGGTGVDSSASVGIAHVSSGTWSFSLITNADISSTSSISRSKIAAGTPNWVVINDSTGLLSEEHYLSTIRGGTSTDSSAASGVAKVSSGTWSFSPITNADISSTSSISRSKIAAGTPNWVVINDSTGQLSEEHYLSTSRGGTSTDSSASTGVAKVSSGSWSYAPITDGDFGTITNLTVSELTVSNIVSSDSLTITPANGNVYYGTTIIHQTPTGIAGGDSTVYTVNGSSSDTTIFNLFVLPISSGNVFTIRALITLADHTGGADSGSYAFIFKGKNISGVTTVSSPIQQGVILDSGIAGASVNTSASGANVLVQVTGVAGKTIKWMGRFDVISQQF